MQRRVHELVAIFDAAAATTGWLGAEETTGRGALEENRRFRTVPLCRFFCVIA